MFEIVLPAPVLTSATQRIGAVALKVGTALVSVALAVVLVGWLFVPFRQMWYQLLAAFKPETTVEATVTRRPPE